MNKSNGTTTSEIYEFGKGFSIDEAVQLIHHEVVRKSDIDKPHSLENIGLISGLITIHDEVEIIIQFYGSVEQFTKRNFEGAFVKVT